MMHLAAKQQRKMQKDDNMYGKVLDGKQDMSQVDLSWSSLAATRSMMHLAAA
jgi:hypothetical protein